ncbi:MAG: VCBS repeat-containing protein [Planctomycetes bacterium]|nr:VCBS repeat-containing protein [Planctomycetota bacterium]
MNPEPTVDPTAPPSAPRSPLPQAARPLRRAWPLLVAAFAGCGEEPAGGGASSPPSGSAAGSASTPSSVPPPAPIALRFALRDEAAARGVVAVNHCGAPLDKRYALEEIGQGCALFDKEGDGDLDLYLVDACGLVAPADGKGDWTLDRKGRCTLLENDGSGRFTDVTEAAGDAGLRVFGAGAIAADYDGDGDVDLYVTCYGENKLLQNDGSGRFADVTAAAGVGETRWSTGAAFFDADGDDDLDLYVGNYFAMTIAGDPDCWNKVDCPYFELKAACGPKGMVPEPDRYYANNGDGTFRDATADAGFAAVEPRYSLGIAAFDADGDGDQDLYVANDSRGNYLFVNDGKGRFSEEADLAGAALSGAGLAQAGMGVAIGDWDGDLDLDLFCTNFSHDDNTLYQNDGSGTFLDVTARHAWGTETWLALGWGTAFEDFDLDGDQDLFVANGHVYPGADARAPELTYKQLCRAYEFDGRYRDVTVAAFPGAPPRKSFRGAAFGDVDGDGDGDVVVMAQNESPALFVNDAAQRASGQQVAFVLEQPGMNRFAIGARIVVEAGGRRQLRLVQAGSSFQSSNEAAARFGLGGATRLERVTVTWPDGVVEEARDLAAGTRWRWRRGTPPQPWSRGS